jgi:hypothetical protein
MVERWHPTLSPGEFLQDLVLLGYSYSLLSQRFKSNVWRKIVHSLFGHGLRGLPSESNEPLFKYSLRSIGLEADITSSAICIFLSLHIGATVLAPVYP